MTSVLRKTLYRLNSSCLTRNTMHSKPRMNPNLQATHTAWYKFRHVYRLLSSFINYSGTSEGSASSAKCSDRSSPSPSTSSIGSLHSPKEAPATPNLDSDISILPEESKGSIPSLPGSPATDLNSPQALHDTENPEFSKMSVYSPSSGVAEAPFSMPESIGSDAQTSTALPAAVSNVQGAKSYFNGESEYAASSNSETPGSYFSPSYMRGFSYSQSSPTSLMSPSAFPAGYNSTSVNGHTTELMSGSSVYHGACVSPSYMSPYSSKQYTWPTPGTTGLNYHGATYSPELMQSGYTYQPSAAAAAYSQMAISRSNYSGYFPPQITTTTSQSC